MYYTQKVGGMCTVHSRYVHTQVLDVASSVLSAPGIIEDYSYKVFTD